MHPASSRASRTNVAIRVGPVQLKVDVYSGTYNAPSATRACIGHEDAPHVPTKVANEAVCSICKGGEHGDVGIIKSTRPGGKGKLVVLPEAAKAAALEASDAHRDEMPLVRVPVPVLEANTLQSADVYWLSPSDGPGDLYAGLVAAVENSPEAVVTRWASQKNVYLYRLVARAGVLGMVKLVAAETLRAAPIEPLVLEEQQQKQAFEMAWMALGMAPSLSAEQLVEISGNPYVETIKAAADKAIESGTEVVRMANQNRTKFGDNLAAASLAALLEGADL